MPETESAETRQVNIRLKPEQHRILRLIALDSGETMAEIVGRLADAEGERLGLSK